MNKIHITIPASSANLGPGFDTLAVAVTLYNDFEFRLEEAETQLKIISGIEESLHQLCLAMIQAAADAFFQHTSLPKTHFSLSIENRVPIARGLASSATLRLAVLVGLNRTLQAGLTDEEIVKIASDLEGCSDNVAASYFGGIAASGIVGGKLVCYHYEMPEELDFIAAWPTDAVETDKARVVFTPTLPRENAVFSVNRATLLTLAILNHDYENLKLLFDDKLHQPYRQANIPALRPLFDVIQAAKTAGALGGYLSGSGSTVMAVALENRDQIAQAMQNVFASYSMDSEYCLLKADNQGIVTNIKRNN